MTPRKKLVYMFQVSTWTSVASVGRARGGGASPASSDARRSTSVADPRASFGRAPKKIPLFRRAREQPAHSGPWSRRACGTGVPQVGRRGSGERTSNGTWRSAPRAEKTAWSRWPQGQHACRAEEVLKMAVAAE